MTKSKCDTCKGCEDKNKVHIFEETEKEYEVIVEECLNYIKEK